MITGDHPATARAIAARLGILDHGGRVVTGAELAALSDADFAAQVRDIRVYARVDPGAEDPHRAGAAGAGEFVAMTGDGVNDAPALEGAPTSAWRWARAAPTSRARRRTWCCSTTTSPPSCTPCARGGASSTTSASSSSTRMTSNSGEIWTIFLAPFLGLPIPLLPIHILWINLVTDGLPGLALAAERAERDVMRRPPRAPRRASSPTACGSTSSGSACSWAASASPCRRGPGTPARRTGRAWCFTVLCLSQLGHVLAIRSETDSLFRIGFGSNRLLLIAVGAVHRPACSSPRSTCPSSTRSSRPNRSTGTNWPDAWWSVNRRVLRRGSGEMAGAARPPLPRGLTEPPCRRG